MKKILLILFFISAVTVSAQWKISGKKLRTNFVFHEEQFAFDARIKSEISRFSDISDYGKVNKKVADVLYQAALYYIRTPELEKIITRILQSVPEHYGHLLIRTIITAKTLYPKKFKKQIESIFNNTHNRKLAVYSLYYMKENNIPDSILAKKLKSKFPKAKDLLIKLTIKDLSEKFSPLTSDEYTEILSTSFLTNHMIIFTFLRHNRKIPGITFIRKPDGEFFTLNDSTLFTIPQLGYSVTNLPYFLEDGNTPQGLFSFQGFYQSPKESIGPTPALITRLPFEVAPNKFFFFQLSEKRWSLKTYLNLLPERLKKDKRFSETYFAGKLGRNKLVVHGSTDNPQYYNRESYYPLTPTTGCLSSVELWDKTTGKNIRSDQLKLVNAILKTGKRKGYLLVVEIDNKERPITKKEILKLIRKFTN